jgi:hypothetical protein
MIGWRGREWKAELPTPIAATQNMDPFNLD